MASDVTQEREQAHELINRMPDTQISALVGLLKTIVEPDEAALLDAPLDDEPETEAERAAVAEARASLQRNGGKGIPHGEAMRRLDLD
jgi:hypothetical protein